ncbi:MAG: FecR family protein [Chryseobacterium sp.]|uniref:FecR family protein n=1 Tax=Chryseobacterium sp. TaxID=1871047 RepID=UPI0025BB261B|nr:FecR family protein [Chryseobacterium sp.]MCJ7935966.1 FecR family protein [Chryseobacterium sp.]
MEKYENKAPENTGPLTAEESARVWENIIAGIDSMERRKQQHHPWILGTVLLLFAVTGIIGYDRYYRDEVFMAAKSPEKIQLKDGTVITLLEGAKLTVKKTLPEKTRDVYLEGNAVFQVAKSKEHPFIVHGLHYETKVLGTVFKVIQNGSTFKVNLYVGKVAVKKTGARQEYFLAPNQTFSNYGKTDIATVTPLKKDKNIATGIGTKKDPNALIRLSFSGSSVKNAIEVIEKSYNITVNYPAEYAEHTISIDMKNALAENILQSIATYLDLKLNIYDTTYTYRLEK